MPMDLLESKPLPRGTLFYNRYRYSVSAYLFEAAVLRSPRLGRVRDHISLDENIEFRDQMLKRNINYGGSWRGNRTRPGKSFSADDILALHETLDWLESNDQDKVVLSDNWLQIYTNDYQSIQHTEFWQRLQHVKLTRVEITHEPDVIQLKDPQHTLRHYFRERWLEAPTIEKLIKFCENYSQEIRLSPSLQERVTGQRRRWMTSNMFIDTSNPHIQLLFEMSFPGLLRKTYRIEPR